MLTDPIADTEDVLLLEQRIRYAYDRPIRHLRHRLVVVPRALHGAQVRTDFEVSVSDERAEVSIIEDAFSNCVARINASAVNADIEFAIWAVVRRGPAAEVAWPSTRAEVSRFLPATPLTHATPEIAAFARTLSTSGASAGMIGELACRWASRAITYGFGVTDVETTAGTALARGTGVCQDYAHIMLAVCRAAGVPARYVSGHLTGEGGSHAWVEVLHGDGTTDDGPRISAFDPTHDRKVDEQYLTVAVGRDYNDVAPTSGTFHGRARSTLTVEKVLRPLAEHQRRELDTSGPLCGFHLARSTTIAVI